MNHIDSITLQHYLDSLFPQARCELFYKRDYELAIAVMLSAQTTDKKVNSVTKKLFDKYDSLDKLATVKFEEIYPIIEPLGLAKTKTNNVIGIAQMLIKDFDSVLPSNKDELMKLPGIGNKSAGVIRAEIFHIPDLPVDTHILRISKRLNLAKEKDLPIDVEHKLKKLFPEQDWIKLHHQLIHFGRYHCTARNPNCENCQISMFCSKNNSNS